jgi:hypothetical protein
MKLGAEPKKTAALAILVIVIPVVYYFTSSDAPSPASSPTAARTAASAIAAPAPNASPVRRARNQSLVKEFKLSLGAKDPKDRPDPATIDPTLRLDLLAKVQNIEPGPPGRNLFQFGTAPERPKPPVVLPKHDKLVVNGPVQPTQPPPPPPRPADPVAPPMTFKYYGQVVSKGDGRKAAFLLDGDDILITSENDTFKQRYRVVRIGISSITIEDTQFKTTQTLQIQELPAV